VKRGIERRLKKLEEKAGKQRELTLEMILDEVNRKDKAIRLLEEADAAGHEGPFSRSFNKSNQGDRD
jgi:hypothetical protein